MDASTPFCRFCQEEVSPSKKEALCKKCGNHSVPITEAQISILPLDAKKKMESGKAIMVDVRWAPERKAAMIEGTIHIPLNEIELHLSSLPKDKEIIMQCRSGSRSRFAAITLLCNGFSDVKNLVGGINQWREDVDPKIPLY